MYICEVCNIQRNLDYTKFYLSKDTSIVTDTFNLTNETKEKFEGLSKISTAIITRQAQGCNYIRLINFDINTDTINFSRNYIKIIDTYKLPTDTISLNLGHNIIRAITYIPPNTEHLNISHNPIYELPILPERLKRLKVNDCRLTEISSFPDTLSYINADNNNLYLLPDNLLQCINLVDLTYENNPNLVVTPDQLDFIEQQFENIRIQEVQQQETQQIRTNILETNTPTIYNYGQNVHNSKINGDLRKSITNLYNKLKNKKAIKMVNNAQMNKQITNIKDKLTSYDIDAEHKHLNKYNRYAGITNPGKRNIIDTLIDYSNVHNKKHAELDLTLYEIIMLWWYSIKDLDKSVIKEIVNIVKSDVSDMNQICYTGKIGRLINSLSGFVDEVNIGITINQQLEARYDIYKTEVSNAKILDDNEKLFFVLYKMYDTYDIDCITTKVSNYNNRDTTTIREWLKAMYDLCDIDKDVCFSKITKCCKTMNIKLNISLDDFYNNVSLL